MAKINLNLSKCPYCGAGKKPGATYCEHCGRQVTSRLHTAKKIFKGSQVLIKSALSRKYREKTMNKMMGKMYGFNVNQNTGQGFHQNMGSGFNQNMGGFKANRGGFQNTGNFTNQSGEYGYLLCDSCPVYYKLDHPLGPEDSRLCGCGGNLIYSKTPRNQK